MECLTLEVGDCFKEDLYGMSFLLTMWRPGAPGASKVKTGFRRRTLKIGLQTSIVRNRSSDRSLKSVLQASMFKTDLLRFETWMSSMQSSVFFSKKLRMDLGHILQRQSFHTARQTRQKGCRPPDTGLWRLSSADASVEVFFGFLRRSRQGKTLFIGTENILQLLTGLAFHNL